jgi:hypothetical protein
MSTFESLGTASAQLASLLERGEYNRLAQLLDSFELQVRQWLMLHACCILGAAFLQGVIDISNTDRGTVQC